MVVGKHSMLSVEIYVPGSMNVQLRTLGTAAQIDEFDIIRLFGRAVAFLHGHFWLVSLMKECCQAILTQFYVSPFYANLKHAWRYL